MTTCGKNWDATVYYKANYKWHHNVKRSERNRIGAVSDSGKPDTELRVQGHRDLHGTCALRHSYHGDDAWLSAVESTTSD
jgi:hypothetical protein